jgi:hypothetical protein
LIPAAAKARGLKVAAGAFLNSNSTTNAAEIDGLVANANNGDVDIAIVGSEAMSQPDSVAPAAIIDYINDVRSRIPAGIPVAAADTFATLLAHPDVIAAGDVVLPNIYPYWMYESLPNAVCALDSAYDQIVAAAGGRPVVISETAGRPPALTRALRSRRSTTRAPTFSSSSRGRARGVAFFYFEAFDESWQATSGEGPVGAHWGVFDKDEAMKAGMPPVFDGRTVDASCTRPPGGTGATALVLSYVPPSSTPAPAILQGTALHVSPHDHRVAVYIYVPNAGWWIKPTTRNRPPDARHVVRGDRPGRQRRQRGADRGVSHSRELHAAHRRGGRVAAAGALCQRRRARRGDAIGQLVQRLRRRRERTRGVGRDRHFHWQ